MYIMSKAPKNENENSVCDNLKILIKYWFNLNKRFIRNEYITYTIKGPYNKGIQLQCNRDRFFEDSNIFCKWIEHTTWQIAKTHDQLIILDSFLFTVFDHSTCIHSYYYYCKFCSDRHIWLFNRIITSCMNIFCNTDLISIRKIWYTLKLVWYKYTLHFIYMYMKKFAKNWRLSI